MRCMAGPVAAILLGIALGSFRAGAAEPPARPPLPPLNAKVVEFARGHLGEPVGDGICVSLAVEALRAAGAEHRPAVDPAGRPGDYAWGEPVPDLRDVLPGDILQFRDAVFAGVRHVRNRRESWNDSYPHHTAVVISTAEQGRLITICHQNVVQRGEDPARVGRAREGTLRMNSMQKGGYLRAYRPVLAGSARGSDRR